MGPQSLAATCTRCPHGRPCQHYCTTCAEVAPVVSSGVAGDQRGGRAHREGSLSPAQGAHGPAAPANQNEDPGATGSSSETDD